MLVPSDSDFVGYSPYNANFNFGSMDVMTWMYILCFTTIFLSLAGSILFKPVVPILGIFVDLSNNGHALLLFVGNNLIIQSLESNHHLKQPKSIYLSKLQYTNVPQALFMNLPA